MANLIIRHFKLSTNGNPQMFSNVKNLLGISKTPFFIPKESLASCKFTKSNDKKYINFMNTQKLNFSSSTALTCAKGATESSPEKVIKIHDHSKHWKAEKALSIFLLGALPLAWVYPSMLVESVVALSVTLHSHWGVRAIVIDYVQPSVVGVKFTAFVLALVTAISMTTLGGLLYFIYSDIGLVNVIKTLWRLDSAVKVEDFV